MSNVKYPYFRFTKWLSKDKELRNWFNWFVDMDIPCCIIRDGERYSLWRTGEEADDHDMGNTEKIEADEIVLSYK